MEVTDEDKGGAGQVDETAMAAAMDGSQRLPADGHMEPRDGSDSGTVPAVVQINAGAVIGGGGDGGAPAVRNGAAVDGEESVAMAASGGTDILPDEAGAGEGPEDGGVVPPQQPAMKGAPTPEAADDCPPGEKNTAAYKLFKRLYQGGPKTRDQDVDKVACMNEHDIRSNCYCRAALIRHYIIDHKKVKSRKKGAKKGDTNDDESQEGESELGIVLRQGQRPSNEVYVRDAVESETGRVAVPRWRYYSELKPLFLKLDGWRNQHLEPDPCGETTLLAFLDMTKPQMSGTKLHRFAFREEDVTQQKLPPLCRICLQHLLDDVGSGKHSFNTFFAHWLNTNSDTKHVRQQNAGAPPSSKRPKRSHKEHNGYVKVDRPEIPLTVEYYSQRCYKQSIKNDIWLGFVLWALDPPEEDEKEDSHNIHEGNSPVITEKTQRFHAEYYTKRIGGRVLFEAQTFRNKYGTVVKSFVTNVGPVVAHFKLFDNRDCHPVLDFRGKKALVKDGVATMATRTRPRTDEECAILKLKHHSNAHVFPVAVSVLERLCNVMVGNWGMYGKDAPVQRWLGDWDRSEAIDSLTYKASSSDARDGMQDLLGSSGSSPCPSGSEIYEALDGFVKTTLYGAIKEVLNGIVPKGRQVDQYKLRHSFSFWMSLLDVKVGSVDTFHRAATDQQLATIAERGAYLFVVFMGVEKCGMWVRILPRARIDRDGKMVQRMDKIPYMESVEKSKPKAMLHPRLAVDDDSSKWVFVAYGSFLVLPGTMYYSQHFRTSNTGNKRCCFCVLAEDEEAVPLAGAEVNYERQYLDPEHKSIPVALLPEAPMDVEASGVHWRSSRLVRFIQAFLQ